MYSIFYIYISIFVAWNNDMSNYRKYMEVLYIKGMNAICTKYSGSKNIAW